MFWALLSAHFSPRYARAKMSLSRAQNIFTPLNINYIVIFLSFLENLVDTKRKLYDAHPELHTSLHFTFHFFMTLSAFHDYVSYGLFSTGVSAASGIFEAD